MKRDLNGPGRPPGRDEQELEGFFRGELRLARAEAPSFEELAAYAEGRLDPESRALLEERLAADPVLRQEADDLRELASQMARSRPAAVRALRWRVAGLGAALAAGLAFVLLSRSGGVPTPSPLTPRPAASPLAFLEDAGGAWTLAADGALSGPSVADPKTARALVAALREGVFPASADLDRLGGRTTVLMGEPRSESFAVQAPVGTRVLGDRPMFRWTSEPGATRYEVTVFDEALERQAASGPLTATEWVPPRPLARGRTYLWQVTATVRDRRITAPAPPLPEARFEIASPSLVEALEGRRAPAPASHLLAAVVLTEAGLLDDAEAEVRALGSDNPGSPEVARLTAALAARRVVAPDSVAPR